MFFKRSRITSPSIAAATEVVAPATPAGETVTPVLDALGQLLAAYAYGLFDMPNRPEGESRAEFDAWRHHAMLGTRTPEEQDDGSESVQGYALSDRDWSGVTRTFGEHRRTEKQFVETALRDLRDALWMCVERTHQALQAEFEAGAAATVHMERVRQALDRLETGVVKTEITEAMRSLEAITERRQTSQREMYGQLASRIEQLGSQLDEAQKASETDALTGLGNRLCFDRSLARQVQLHTLAGNALTLVLVDLDRLKPINDRLGHQEGDRALNCVAKALHRVFLREQDTVCRIGGDEFAILLPNTTQPLAQRLLSRFDSALGLEPWPHTEAGHPLSASAAAEQWLPGESIEQWIKRTDEAMYAIKASKVHPT